MRTRQLGPGILAACQFLTPAVWGLTTGSPKTYAHPQMTYPTTVTRVSSSTSTEVTPYNPILPIDWYSKTVISTVTVTILEPWPTSPASFPHTMLQTAVSRSTVEVQLLKTIDAPMVTSIYSGTITGTSTWVLWQPSPTDLPAGSSLPCKACAPSNWTPDSRCVRLGLDTACQGQCEDRDGLLWCYQRYYSDSKSLAMGRVCWGNKTEYAQLVEPCVVADHALPCVPCNGSDYSWNSVNWHWDL